MTTGRGSADVFYDDSSYILVGETLTRLVDSAGWFPAMGRWLLAPPHTPWSEGIAFATYRWFDSSPNAVYVVNSILSTIIIVILSCALCKKWYLRFAVSALLIASPLGYLLSNEFRPDIPYAFVASYVLIATANSLTGKSGRKCPRTWVPPMVGMCLLFLIKPTYFPISFLVFAIVFTSSACCLLSGAARRRFDTLALPVAGVLFVLIWLFLYAFPLYEYTIVAGVQSPYRTTSGHLVAVTDSFSQAWTYIGDQWKIWYLLPLAFAAIITISACSFLRTRGRLRRPSLWLLLPAGVGLFSMFATGVSKHSSPFQGLFALVLVLVSALATVLFVLRPTLTLRSPAVAVMVLLLSGALITSAMYKSPIVYPQEHSMPVRATESIARIIKSSCESAPSCARLISGDNHVVVLETLMADLNPQQLNIYLLDEGLPSTVVAPPEHIQRASDVQKLFQLGTANAKGTTTNFLPGIFRDATPQFVVTGAANYPYNGVPLNMVQEELNHYLVASSDWKEVKLPQDIHSYRLFQRTG